MHFERGDALGPQAVGGRDGADAASVDAARLVALPASGGSLPSLATGTSPHQTGAFECDAHFRTTTVVKSVVNLRRPAPIRAAIRA